jgi:hypothetical protein
VALKLADLFPAEDYRFSMRFQRGEIAEFFAPTSQQSEILVERKRWLRSAPETYAALLPGGEPLLEETIELLRAAQPLTEMVADGSALERCVALGEAIEPDFLLLISDREGVFRLLGGCLCFPSSWRLTDKLGKPLDAIHSAVPGLNLAIGPQISTFLSRLKPGIAWLRANWGLSRSRDLNQHPDRVLPKVDATARLEEIWLRVEHQALVTLPRHQGVLFGIRIALHRLSDLAREPTIASGFSRALRTMPEAVAQYKNLLTARDSILSSMEQQV